MSAIVSRETMAPDAFRAQANVSRETIARLETYAAALRRWNQALSLVSAASLTDLWRRHFLDSAQLLPLAPSAARVWLDLGSGAGFPGMILAMLGAPDVHLVESERRKCEFLRAVARDTATELTIHCRRVEDMPALNADVVTARALAPLPRLIALTGRFATADTIGLFPKGARVVDEWTDLAKYPTINVERVASRSSSSGTILRVKGFSDT